MSNDENNQGSRLSRRNFIAGGVGAVAYLASKPSSALAAPALPSTKTPAPQNLTELTLKQASDLLRRKEVSSVDLTMACLDRIEKFNPRLNAFITVVGDQALANARQADIEIKGGHWRGPLHGVPIALKDNMDTAGIRTTGASELFKDRVPTEDSEVARRLKAAGAILLGKLNLREFAAGGDSITTAFGTMHNPWALDRVTGGSSGGPGVAVAADLCYAALGTDTAGSVRMPSSHCGLAGLKPTYGRVSNRGELTLSWTLDHTGPMCHNVEDVALMMNVIAGYDDRDPATVDVPVPDYTQALKMPTSKLRLGIPRAGFYDNLDPEVAKVINDAIEVLRKLTASIQDNVELPSTAGTAIVWQGEEYTWHEKYFRESPEKYQPSTRAGLERNSHVTIVDYINGRNKVDQLRQEIRKTFTNVDLLITPTMKTPPGLLNAPAAPAAPAGTAPTGAGANGVSSFDAFGLPTISIRCGFSSLGLPVGLSISGAHWAEPTVLSLAAAYERSTDWLKRRPTLT
jgi:aspartyl-tRNA(Asn)/glutamyl-tRNA(Gln) amidotransferase subunit A